MFPVLTILLQVKWYSSSWETHLRATERYLPYGITQCHLPPDTGEQVNSASYPHRDGKCVVYQLLALACAGRITNSWAS